MRSRFVVYACIGLAEGGRETKTFYVLDRAYCSREVYSTKQSILASSVCDRLNAAYPPIPDPEPLALV